MEQTRSCGCPVSSETCAEEEGYCCLCGRKVRDTGRDRREEVISADCAGLSDRGLRRAQNEDRYALIAEAGGWGLVVCDGVASTPGAAAAAETVARSIAGVLRRELLTSQELPGGLETVLRLAAAEAQTVLEDKAQGRWAEADASTTLVAAVLRGRELGVLWAGDSRAYWIDEDGTVTQLTYDHTGSSGMEVGSEEAPAEGLLRWMGAGKDVQPEGPPEVTVRSLDRGGALLLATDGLWNHMPREADVERVLRQAGLGRGAPVQEVLAMCVAHALDGGGQDNITAALLRWRPEPRNEPGEPLALPERTQITRSS